MKETNVARVTDSFAAMRWLDINGSDRPSDIRVVEYASSKRRELDVKTKDPLTAWEPADFFLKKDPQGEGPK